MAAGGLRVNGTDLEWRDANDTVRSVTGSNQGATSVPVGAIRVNGTDLEYVDENGDHRIITPDGQVTDSKASGGIAVFEEDLRYIDGNGDRQFIVPIALSSGDFVPIVDPANTFDGWNENGDSDGDFADEIDEGTSHDSDSTYVSWTFGEGGPTTRTFNVRLESVGDNMREFQDPFAQVVARMAGVTGSPTYDITLELWDGDPTLGGSDRLETGTFSQLTNTNYIGHNIHPDVSKIRNAVDPLFIRVETSLNIAPSDTAQIRVTAAHIFLS